jgi:glycosyltransferase involved in cell wall biosynthesis
MNKFSQLPLSIITIHKGDFSKLLKTGQSLKNIQSISSEFEWVIITDETVLLEDFNQFPPAINIRLVSVRDSGPFDAMNKSIEHARGKVINFLNSGDQISPNVDGLKLKSEVIQEDFNWGVAKATYVTNSGLKSWKMPTSGSWKFKWCLNSYCHQATFYNKTFLADSGKFSLSSMVADWEMSVVLNSFSLPLQVEVTYCIYEGGGLSSHPKLYEWMKNVLAARRRQGIGFFVSDFCSAALIFFYLGIRRIFIRRIEKL